ncbi:GATA transcription factor 1-like protein [Cinnamomum micranthum f. kanehirae]|uniref:GATA transcription factor 1-like protein n=1 Tax=Cinnamomum micranthum f. kanehirae TaxID=337451 RepID=A0A3S3R8G7_9MAGN|nr:GATA transcription factor 1-like protein [Cinnamomum micranthum f. kanehirae]
MDPFEEALCIFEDFLSFPSDLDDLNPKDEQQQHQDQKYQKHLQNSSKMNTQLSVLNSSEDSFPVLEGEEEEEEELEWLKEEFPPLEPFIVGGAESPKHHSPVSVLENGVWSSGFRVPVRARSRTQRRRRVGAPGLFGVWGGGGDGKSGAAEARRCRHCMAEKTPQWRAGPLGPKTLCNACGVRYKAGRLVPEYRPASSPTFSIEMHSNSHRKIIEMRKKRQQKALENG